MGNMAGDWWTGWMIGLAAVMLVIYAWMDAQRAAGGGKGKGKKKPKLVELKRAKPEDAHGIIFGLDGSKVIYSPTSAEGSVGVFSASGTGKTTAIGVPTLRAWDGTAFAIDISGDICRNTYQMDNKIIFAPEIPSQSAKYNVFGVIDELKDVDAQNEALEQLALLIMPESPQMADAARYFLTGGRKILTAALIAFYHQGVDFVDICAKVAGLSWQALFGEIDAADNPQASIYINSFEGGNEKNVAGCKEAVDGAIKLFAVNSKVRRCVGRPVDGREYIVPKMIEDHNIFVCVDDPLLALYEPLLGVICAQMMQYISAREVDANSRNILLFLDEYASLRIDSQMILEALRKYRKRRCRVMILTQNVADLDILYGHDVTRALVANMRYKCLLGGLGETESQQFFANLIGYKDTENKSVSRSAKSVSVTRSEAKEYIIAPADLDKIGKDDMLLICPDAPGWMRLTKNHYFEADKRAAKKAEKKAKKRPRRKGKRAAK